MKRIMFVLLFFIIGGSAMAEEMSLQEVWIWVKKEYCILHPEVEKEIKNISLSRVNFSEKKEWVIRLRQFLMTAYAKNFSEELKNLRSEREVMSELQEWEKEMKKQGLNFEDQAFIRFKKINNQYVPVVEMMPGAKTFVLVHEMVHLCQIASRRYPTRIFTEELTEKEKEAIDKLHDQLEEEAIKIQEKFRKIFGDPKVKVYNF